MIRMSADGSITMVQDEDGSFHVPSQWEMDHLAVGDDLTDEEIALLDE
jgi:hypothetical protein